MAVRTSPNAVDGTRNATGMNGTAGGTAGGTGDTTRCPRPSMKKSQADRN